LNCCPFLATWSVGEGSWGSSHGATDNTAEDKQRGSRYTRITKSLAAFTLSEGLLGAVPALDRDETVMIVFDGSNAMWGQIDGTAKINRD